MHDLNLYQVLYALTKITSDTRYAAAADETLAWFFKHCQSPATGLFAWGEHLGWDFNQDGRVDYEDYLELFLRFGGPNINIAADWAVFDFQRDGDIDLADFSEFQNLFVASP